MFNTKITFALTVFLTTMFILFVDGVSNNPSIFNIAILALITIMATILFFDKGAK